MLILLDGPITRGGGGGGGGGWKREAGGIYGNTQRLWGAYAMQGRNSLKKRNKT